MEGLEDSFHRENKEGPLKWDKNDPAFKVALEKILVDTPNLPQGIVPGMPVYEALWGHFIQDKSQREFAENSIFGRTGIQRHLAKGKRILLEKGYFTE